MEKLSGIVLAALNRNPSPANRCMYGAIEIASDCSWLLLIAPIASDCFRLLPIAGTAPSRSGTAARCPSLTAPLTAPLAKPPRPPRRPPPRAARLPQIRRPASARAISSDLGRSRAISSDLGRARAISSGLGRSRASSALWRRWRRRGRAPRSARPRRAPRRRRGLLRGRELGLRRPLPLRRGRRPPTLRTDSAPRSKPRRPVSILRGWWKVNWRAPGRGWPAQRPCRRCRRAEGIVCMPVDGVFFFNGRGI